MYMYKKLRESVGIPTDKSGVQTRNWTPNDVKAIVVMRNFILVAHHTKMPRVVLLDTNESYNDIVKNGTSGSLHNLLSQKQLSCLEEIYVDSVFQNYMGVFNLDKYVASLVNTASRLRYYGYSENVNVEEVKNFYSTGIVNGTADYCYALQKGRQSVLQYNSTGNEDSWFKKYNLRPENYYLDSPKLALSMKLKSIENKMAERKAKELEELQSRGLNACLTTLFRQDLGYANSLICLLRLRNKLTVTVVKKDPICRQVKSSIQEVLKKGSDVRVSMDSLKTALSGSGINPAKGSKEELLLKFYSDIGVFSNEGKKMSLDEYAEKAKLFTGISCLPDLLYSICRKIIKTPKSTVDMIPISCYMLLSLDEVESCKGDLIALIDEKRKSQECVAWYVTFLLGLCGYTRESVMRG